MTVVRIVFWRHGQTEQNRLRRIQGSSDIPLNDTGMNEARAAAKELARMKPTRIYSSQLGRALNTAQYLADETGLEIKVDERLRERGYGLWEGLTSDEIKASYAEQWQTWRDGLEPVDVDVETRKGTGDRVVEAVLDAIADVEAESLEAGAEETIVFVAHGGSISNGIISLLGQNPSEWVGLQGMDNCRWAILEPRPGANPQWRLRSYNRRTVMAPNIIH